MEEKESSENKNRRKLRTTSKDKDNFDAISETLEIIGGMYSKLPSMNFPIPGSIYTPTYQELFNMDNPSFDQHLSLQLEISELKRQLTNKVGELKQVSQDSSSKDEIIRDLINKIDAKEKLNHVLSRICEPARQKLLNSVQFQDEFKNSRTCDAVVVSIDIRRSTELMLKARKPELFSKFITELSGILSEIIMSNFGIFDKFTGDGILAFFPTFFAGEDSIIRAAKAAEECHMAFNQHYKNSRECFNVFITDVGLGIGIDFGNVTLVNTSNELTVVGIPVVYACRMSGAKAGETLFNQPAKEELCRLVGNQISAYETEIHIKNEGNALAYRVDVNPSVYNLSDPSWLTDISTDENLSK